MHNKRYKRASTRIAKRNKVKNFFVLFIKIGLPLALLVGTVFFLRADFLQVKSFEVLGAETLSKDSIKNMASGFTLGNKFLILPKSNLIFLNKKKLEDLLLSKFSRLASVNITKHFLNKSIEINITERKPEFLWCSPINECFFMTEAGLVFEKANLADGKLIFQGLLGGNPLMQSFATPPEIENYLKFVEILKEASFKTISINIESPDKAIAKTDIGNIFFDPEEVDLTLVAQNTIILINEIKAKNPNAKFNYIDARFDNKFFYKLDR